MLLEQAHDILATTHHAVTSNQTVLLAGAYTVEQLEALIYLLTNPYLNPQAYEQEYAHEA